MDRPARPRPFAHAVSLFLLAVAALPAGAGIGRTPGFATVSEDGEAQYTIPIALPPGTNGMTPELALVYRHRTRNGALGVGWSLAGLSRISRCPQTVAQDGAARSLHWDATDRFCLDGQRLVNVNNAVYGAPGSEYRTEIESFARIRAVDGASTNGPMSFTVENADGRTLEYGATNDSRIDSSKGASTLAGRAWTLNRIRDRAGNVIDYRYTEDTANRSNRIAAILYNANPSRGIAAWHEVRFGYEAGRLATIELRHLDAVLRRYELAYEPAPTTGGRSRLASVRECAGTGTDCLAATRFAWSEASAGFGPVTAFTTQSLGYPTPVIGRDWNLADVNGDGRTDYLWRAGGDAASQTLRYRLSLADGDIGPMVDTRMPAWSTIGRVFEADGDGNADVLNIAPEGFTISRGGPAGLGPAAATGIARPDGLLDFRGADLNGDGLGDIAWSENRHPDGNSLRVCARFARQGGGFGPEVTLYAQFAAHGNAAAWGGNFLGAPGERIDFDANGAEDLLLDETYAYARISATGYGIELFDERPSPPVLLDFDGDGCTDFAYAHAGSASYRIRRSQCTIAGAPIELQGPARVGSAEVLALDWNADGLDDLLVRGPENWLVAASRGDSAAPFVDTGAAHEAAHALAGRDLDGDGLEDIATFTRTQLRVRYRSGPLPDLLETARDGFGVSASFHYAPLTAPGIHVRGDTASWPEADLQSGEPVVASLVTTDGSGEGGVSTASFRYEGQRRNVQGRGSLGFARFTRTDGASGGRIATELTRRQDHPFTGLPASVVVRSPGGTLLSSVDYRWSQLSLGVWTSLRRHPWPSKVTTRHYEAEGALAGRELTRTVRTIAAIDATSGLATDSTTTSTEVAGGANPGSSSTLRVLQTSPLNDIANWCLGRAQAVAVSASHSLPGGAARTREAEQAWDAINCRPTRIRLLPGDPGSQVIHDLSYDAFGNLAREKVTGIGMTPRSVSTSWGARGQLPVRITDPLGKASNFSWDDSRGLLASFTDPNGIATRWSYDAFGRTQRETLPDGTATQWLRKLCRTGCDPRARYRFGQQDLDASGTARISNWLEVDQFDRAVKIELQQAGGGRSVAAIVFDARGNAVSRELPHWKGDAAPGHAAFTYDLLGRATGDSLVEASGAVKRQSSVAYDGLSVVHDDPLRHATTTTRLAWGPVAEIVDALGGRTRYEHDAFGAVVRVRDAANDVVSTLAYDPRGFKTSADDADLGAWTWTRNALGETTAVRDARGQVTQFTYDLLGRLTKRTAPDGISKWVWGVAASARNIGRLASVTSPGYGESFGYDAAGRPSVHTVTADASYRFDYSYNGLGLLDTMAFPPAGNAGALRLRFEYDAGRVLRIGDAATPSASLWTQNAVDADGRALDESLGASVRVISGYAPVGGELEYREAATNAGAKRQDVAYAWDAAGNLSRRQDRVQGLAEDFRYDALDRLLQSRRNGTVSLELDYDPVGNIRRKSGVCTGTAPCYAYHATKKHAAISAGGVAYGYDANGNVISRSGAPIAWSSENRPVSLMHANGNASQFSYGPDGNRWKQLAVEGAASETTVYAGGAFEKTTRGGVTTWRHYVTAPGGVAILLRYSNGAPPATRFLTLDHLGSTDRVLDAAGSVVASASFGPFGERRKASWTGVPTAAELAQLAAATRDGFTGHEQLDHLGLIHMNGRVYDPALGRFISADPHLAPPWDGQGLNRYAYALNNPLAYTDPSGFDAIPCATSPEGNCAQVTVIGVSWADYMRAFGGAHSSEIASALERDPCGQNGSALACAMQSYVLVPPSSIVLTVGDRTDPTLPGSRVGDTIRGFAARSANIAISSSPIAMLFGADPGFEYFHVPDSNGGRAGAIAGTAAYFAAGIAGAIRKVGQEAVAAAPSTVARAFQGTKKYPNIDRFKDISLKKGTLVYSGFPGQSAFYTTARALQRSGAGATALWKGLQVAKHQSYPPRSRMAVYEVLDDTPAAFGLARANFQNGAGGYPQIVVPSYETSLRYLFDFSLGP
jgi:RHS repeat-associated protein